MYFSETSGYGLLLHDYQQVKRSLEENNSTDFPHVLIKQVGIHLHMQNISFCTVYCQGMCFCDTSTV